MDHAFKTSIRQKTRAWLAAQAIDILAPPPAATARGPRGRRPEARASKPHTAHARGHDTGRRGGAGARSPFSLCGSLYLNSTVSLLLINRKLTH